MDQLLKFLFKFIGQESAQVFIVTAGLVLGAWSWGAPDNVLYIVGGLGCAFILGEKFRAAKAPPK